MPRELSTRPALDEHRVRWYGEEVMHRQLYDWLNGARNMAVAGVAYFF
jgi:hypothetical protein